MLPWTLFELVPPGETKGVVSVWKDGVAKKVWTTFQTRWRDMRKVHQAQWPPTWATPVVGYSGILEMRLKVSQHQYRPLFIFGPPRASIIFVFMADEVGDEFVPKDAPDRAQAIRTEIIEGRSKFEELDNDQ
ncbi:MAG: hypothetical protein Q7S58_07100 [Candidatus Binatus sp.]|uniref:hypothetical protein n=1 Tax=Candidatus Binatus sp. TaxID=2811406 RepID=UPI00272202FF|nr:hypothetical protein [Candidatus Binatus sp.]MDO8432164.1 hypothetical protein [Candidatus Binatus sp.]